MGCGVKKSCGGRGKLLLVGKMATQSTSYSSATYPRLDNITLALPRLRLIWLDVFCDGNVERCRVCHELKEYSQYVPLENLGYICSPECLYNSWTDIVKAAKTKSGLSMLSYELDLSS